MEGQKFRVIIVIPLVPGFPGEIYENQKIQTVLKYTYRSINRNRGHSIIEKLYELMGEKVFDHIAFYSLRNHAIIEDVPKTELIYIHSKMMIVDDEITVIGSANINDRSMLGSRDSEIAVVIRENDDRSKIKSVINGQNVIVSNFARSLRLRLFKVNFKF